jgi:hypothetical protein
MIRSVWRGKWRFSRCSSNTSQQVHRTSRHRSPGSRQAASLEHHPMNSIHQILRVLSRGHNRPAESLLAAQANQARNSVHLAEILDEHLESFVLPCVRYAFDVHGALLLLFSRVFGWDGDAATIGIQGFISDPGIVAACPLAQDIVKELHMRSGRKSNVVSHCGTRMCSVARW